jgi:hypothetical protein
LSKKLNLKLYRSNVVKELIKFYHYFGDLVSYVNVDYQVKIDAIVKGRETVENQSFNQRDSDEYNFVESYMDVDLQIDPSIAYLDTDNNGKILGKRED